MEEKGRYLTRREFEEVMRRAAELASRDTDSEDRSMSESEVRRIAGEVGIPDSHVRRALAEVQVEGLPGSRYDRFLGPQFVRVARPVPGSPEEIASALDEFLVAGRLLQAVRRGRSVMVYRPAVDWVSQVARAASSTSRAYYVASAKHVEVRLASAGDDTQTMVELEVDPGIRGDYAAGVFMGGGFAGLVAGAGVGVSLALVAPVALAVAAGVASAAGVGVAVAWAAARGHKKKLLEVRTEMEGILDRLESGDTLEPPPPSWRRWVRRHFHGVARDLMGDEDAV